jgi:transposase
MNKKQRVMSKFKLIIGIDISKNTFDASRLWSDTPGLIEHQVFEQTKSGLVSFVKWLKSTGVEPQQTLLCMEHTGLYIHGLLEHLSRYDYVVWVEMPLRIKRSIGLQRGGDDKLSSKLIAQYAYRYQDACKSWVAEDAVLLRLRQLIAQRDRMVRQVKALEVPVGELKQCEQAVLAQELEQIQRKTVSALKTAIKEIESRVAEIVKTNASVQKKIDCVTSIKGISTQTAIHLYVYTKGFTAYENGKQLASYCGVVPFERRSGISVRHRPRVSRYANKDLKRLLHLCAMCAIRHDKELRSYYQRKVLEGKNKMSVVNAVRNKLIQRVFAVVRDERKWVENYVYSC